VEHCLTKIEKRHAYLKLVDDRKNCHLCKDHGLTNPSVCEGGRHDNTGHIGPWTQWQGNLDAELMVVGQDWGSVGYYVRNEGIEKDTNETNRNLCDLLSSIGTHVKLPNQPQVERPLFFTNAVLCLRPGNGLTGPTPPRACFRNCSSTFLKPQIVLVNPRIVVSLGFEAYCAILKAYGKKPHGKMGAAVGQVVPLGGRTNLVPVFHPGHYGTMSRHLEEQMKDWRLVGEMLRAST